VFSRFFLVKIDYHVAGHLVEVGRQGGFDFDPDAVLPQPGKYLLKHIPGLFARMDSIIDVSAQSFVVAKVEGLECGCVGILNLLDEFLIRQSFFLHGSERLFLYRMKHDRC
jgi:hypothetical protein